ncbi:MAG: hypothetical protein EP344_01320 [Bacteroidetes bacterium]|nr:MAG: hypothetical protein EP344_01320 [Bacteroidota bacterium]
MKNVLLAAMGLLLLDACVVPINTSFESARMLQKGAGELTGHYTYYTVHDDESTEGINNNFGLRLGYGIADAVDIKARYERLVPKEEGASGINYIDLAPKVALWPGRIAGTVPVGVYFDDEDHEWVISPKLLFTLPANDQFEATFAAKADIFPEEGADDYLGFNLGFGISNNLNRWALRPEVGVLINPGESGSSWAWGIGFNAILPHRNKGGER